MSNRINQFLTYLGRNVGTSIPIRSLWVVDFLPKNPSLITDPSSKDYNPFLNNSIEISEAFRPATLEEAINNVLNIYESTGGGNRKQRFPVNKDIGFITQDRDGTTPISFLANKITLPTDAVSIDYTSNSGQGGLRGGYYAMEREKYQSIDIEFLYTYTDIFEYLLRPWALAVAYKGLVEDGDVKTTLKCDMKLSLYSKQSTSEFDARGVLTGADRDWGLRKAYYFHGVAPISVPGEDLSYDPDASSKITRTASFTFKDYYAAAQ